MDQFDHQAAVMVQMAIIAEGRRQNVHPHAGPSGAWGPNDEKVDKMRCASTHCHLSREQLSKLPNSNSSVDTWVDEVRSKGKGTDAFPWGAGHGTLRWTRASEQAGKALRSQGHQCAPVM